METNEKEIILSPPFSANIRWAEVTLDNGKPATYPIYYSTVDPTPRIIADENLTPEISADIIRKLERRLKFEAKKGK
jgi:hypothetical protein